MAELALAGVSKAFGRRPVLLDVDLEVDGGEIVGLMGANGAGKTTLMAIVAGLLRPDRGRVFVCGIDVARRPRAAKARLGLAPQDVGVYPAATVRENLRLFAVLNGVRRDVAGAIDEAAEAMGIAGLLDRPAGVLSGGEQRRAPHRVALLHRPRVLLLVEPTVGADVATRSLVLRACAHALPPVLAVLYSTHYLHELDALGASLAVLDHGRVVARGHARGAHCTGRRAGCPLLVRRPRARDRRRARRRRPRRRARGSRDRHRRRHRARPARARLRGGSPALDREHSPDARRRLRGLRRAGRERAAACRLGGSWPWRGSTPRCSGATPDRSSPTSPCRCC